MSAFTPVAVVSSDFVILPRVQSVERGVSSPVCFLVVFLSEGNHRNFLLIPVYCINFTVKITELLSAIKGPLKGSKWYFLQCRVPKSRPGQRGVVAIDSE